MSNIKSPVNIGSDRLVSINELVDIVSKISNKKVNKVYLPNKPQGVRGRNSDNSYVRKVLGWEPKISLEEGLSKTYYWIEQQVKRQ
jgi:nucleoside-diphosphate-sugar epimerase